MGRWSADLSDNIETNRNRKNGHGCLSVLCCVLLAFGRCVLLVFGSCFVAIWRLFCRLFDVMLVVCVGLLVLKGRDNGQTSFEEISAH